VKATTPSAMAEYSLVDLANAANLPTRTIRYYQAVGLLPRPRRRGKQAIYTEEHLQRLKAIARLREQGLRLETIRKMLDGQVETSRTVVELLGPGMASSAWLETSARTFTEGELAELLGDDYPELVSDLVKAGYLEIRADMGQPRAWYAPNLPQLRGALELAKYGTDIALSGRAADLLRKRLRRLAEEFVEMWISEAGNLYAGEATREEFELNLELFRSVAWQSAAYVMAQEMESAIAKTDEIGEHRKSRRSGTSSSAKGVKNGATD